MAALDFLLQQRLAHADLSESLGEIETLYSSRMWHQLTVALGAFVRQPSNSRGDNLIQLYESFISTFESKLNQLQLVLIVAQIATQYFPSRPYVVAELESAIALLTRVASKRERPLSSGDRLPDDAFLVVRMEILSLQLRKAEALAVVAKSDDAASATALNELLDSAKKQLAEGRTHLDALPAGAEPVVAATFHRVAAEYYKLRGPAHLFYESALLFLGATPIDALPADVRASIAVDVALAALVGEGVYDFGEVNQHPILASLRGTPYAWLVDLLQTFQTGDIDQFNAVISSNRAHFDSQPALAASAAIVKEKITLMAVVELAARKPSAERAIAFTEIAHVTRLPLAQVEWVLMRALSLGLISGRMDGVDQVIHVSFVRPRVLDAAQIAALKQRIDDIRARSKDALVTLEEKTAGMFA